MADNYQRDCRDCNEPIRLAKMDNGQWLAFDLSGGKHVCALGVGRAAVVDSPSLAPPVQRSFDVPASGHWVGRGVTEVSNTLPRWLWIVLMVLVLIVMFLNWVSGWLPW